MLQDQEQDQDLKCQDQDQDRRISVLSGLKTKTAVLRTTTRHTSSFNSSCFWQNLVPSYSLDTFVDRYAVIQKNAHPHNVLLHNTANLHVLF